jgi:hypothetical protein
VKSWLQKIVQILLSANLDNLLKFKKIFFWFISVKKWCFKRIILVLLHRRRSKVSKTRDLQPQIPRAVKSLFQKIVQILLSANLENLLKFKKIFFWFMSVKKWFQTNYFGAAAEDGRKCQKHEICSPKPPVL